MSLPFSVGDFIAVSELIVITVERCKSASKDFSDLRRILQAALSCIQSARYSVADVLETLPAVHRRSIANAISGISEIVRDIQDQLSSYSGIRSNSGLHLSKLKFALFYDPRKTESKLTLWMTTLNTCMASVTW